VVEEHRDSLTDELISRQKAQEEKARLIDELAAKNEELERFTYTVSHDLKSPLITIGGFLGALKKDLADGRTSRIESDMKQIGDSAKMMGSLLEDLLELSRIGRVINETEDVPLTDLAREAVRLVEGRIAEKGARVDISPDLPTVRGDRQRLLEVFQNLVDNAVKFMGSQPEPCVTIASQEQNGETAVYVRDNGIGIDERYHGKVFDLFERLDPEMEGTGIGLTLVRRIVEVHGGRVWVESEGSGRGSTMFFTLGAGR
jgi:signal transduction histidine kinase